MRIPLRRVFPALFVLCFGLSLLPGLPVHGYGQLWFALPLLFWFRNPEHRRRLLLFSAGIVVQVLAFPDIDWGVLGWVLLVPYLLARECRDGAHPWAAAFLYGFLRAHVGFFWLGWIHFVAWFAVSVFSAALFALLFEGTMRLLSFVPYALRVATGWVLFEWGHARLFGGFPWLFLSHTQYGFRTVIQAADLVGAAGLSFLLAYGQAAALRVVRERRWAEGVVAALLLAATLAYGGLREGPGEGPREEILLVQTNFAHSVKTGDGLTLESLLDKLYGLTLEGLVAHPECRLVVWPETMFPYPYVEGDPEDTFEFESTLRLLAQEFRRPVLYGINSFTSIEKARRLRGYNALLLADEAGGIAGIYRKQRLVPMGEEFLLRRLLPERWCDRVMDFMIRWFRYPESCDLEAGEGFVLLDAGPGLLCAPLICFEGLYPDLAREVLERGEADLILHLMNNGWFGPFEPRQAIASWVFRAVEARMPFVSCANVGQSCLVEPDGTISAKLEPVPAEGFLLARIPRPWPVSLYRRGGYLALPLVLAGLLLLFGLRARPWAASRGGGGGVPGRKGDSLGPS